MITSCPKSQETPKFSLNSFRRGNVPINAVLSNNIPSETLTPLKDLVKYKNNNLNDNNNTNDLREHLNPEMEHFKSEISSLQSTVIAGHLNSNNFSRDFDEKASEHKGAMFSNEEVFKRNETFDIVTCESPAKLFQRMKTRSLLATQKQSVPDSLLLELQRTQRDVILSPLLSERSRLDKTFISGFPDCHKESSDERSLSGGELPIASGRKASSHAKETSLKNFQNSLFLPVKQKITRQQEKQFCHHNLTYDITTSKEKHENISTSLILSEALTMSKSSRLLQEDEKRVTSIEFSQCDTLILENIDADDERSQSPNVISTNCEHVNSGSQLSKCDNEVPTEGLLEPETSEENERKIPETVQQGTTSDMCKILITTPKTHTIAPEKKGSKVSTSSSHANKNTLVTKKKEICLQNWMIRNMNNNTAVCVEGKLMDTPDLYWHSNAIVERLDYNKLKTLTGNIYILKGTIDTVSMKEAGFPANFTRKFIFGFPKNWKQYVDDLLQELRTFSKKEKKSKIDKETDKYVFEMRMKKSDTSEETESETLSRSARNKNNTYDVSENCSEELPTGCIALPRSSEFNLCPINKPHKVPLKLRYGEFNNCDNQINITFQTEGKNCLHKEESTVKSENKQMTSPKKIRNHEAKTNEAIFKSLKRVRNNAVKDATQELIESSDTQSSREEVLSDTEKMECINNIERKLAVVLTPMNSRKTLEQKCKEHNLSISTIKRISELALPKHKIENAGYKALLRKNKNNRLLRSLEVTFGSGLISKSEDDEDTGIGTSSTISQKIKMPLPPKEQSPTSDPEKKLRKSLRLKRIDPTANISSHKIQTKVSEISSQESETEEDSRKKVHFGMKTKQKNSKETPVDQSKCKRKDTRKSPVILEHESEESDKDFHTKTKKTISTNKTVQKTGNRRKVSSAQLRSRKTKEQPLESFPGLIKDDNWTEKELQKLQGALSTVPKQKHGYWLNGTPLGSSQTAEECQKKHIEEHQGKGSRKRAIKKMVPSPKVSNGTGADTDTSQPVKITARVGTLKRKQQMRDFLEQLPKDDHDDMFSGSPLHNQRVQLPNFEVSQDDDFLHMDRDPTTPSSVIYPLAKTPQCQHVSPGMLESVNRKDFDKYVFQMQKESKSHGGIVWGNVKKKLVGTDFTTPVSRRTSHFKKGIKSDIGKLFTQSTKLNFDEEDQDDYFSNSDSAE